MKPEEIVYSLHNNVVSRASAAARLKINQVKSENSMLGKNP